MTEIFALASTNLLSPMVLFFVLGFGAALARSDLSIPEMVAKAVSLYLMLAIGFKGGVSLVEHGLDAKVFYTALAGVIISFALPFLGFFMLRLMTNLSATDAGAIAAHYGSISIVTFVAASEMVTSAGLDYEGYLVGVLALMETPAIISGLWLAARYSRNGAQTSGFSPELFREVLLNGSVVLLIGAFVIGMITGVPGREAVAAFVVDPFKGVLCFFLLEMGLVAARRLRESRNFPKGLTVYALIMPLIGASIGGVVAALIGLSPGGVALFATLCASASYIAVPAAMRLALPEANPGLYLTASLAVTFPFNLTVGIPLYMAAAQVLTGGQ